MRRSVFIFCIPHRPRKLNAILCGSVLLFWGKEIIRDEKHHTQRSTHTRISRAADVPNLLEIFFFLALHFFPSHTARAHVREFSLQTRSDSDWVIFLESWKFYTQKPAGAERRRAEKLNETSEKRERRARVHAKLHRNEMFICQNETEKRRKTAKLKLLWWQNSFLSISLFFFAHSEAVELMFWHRWQGDEVKDNSGPGERRKISQ